MIKKNQLIIFSIIAASSILFFIQSKSIRQGPTISHITIQETEGFLTINGSTRNTANIYLNGNSLPLSITGDFSHRLSPLPGLTEIEIRLEDRFGNAFEKTYSSWIR